jgi:hypothetical protein
MELNSYGLCAHHIIFDPISPYISALIQVLWHLAASDYVCAPHHICGHMSELTQMWRLVQVLWHLTATDCVCTTSYLWSHFPHMSAHAQMLRIVQELRHQAATDCVFVHHIITVATSQSHVWECSDMKSLPSIMAPSSYLLCAPCHICTQISSTYLSMLRCGDLSKYYVT